MQISNGAPAQRLLPLHLTSRGDGFEDDAGSDDGDDVAAADADSDAADDDAVLFVGDDGDDHRELDDDDADHADHGHDHIECGNDDSALSESEAGDDEPDGDARLMLACCQCDCADFHGDVDGPDDTCQGCGHALASHLVDIFHESQSEQDSESEGAPSSEDEDECDDVAEGKRDTFMRKWPTKDRTSTALLCVLLYVTPSSPIAYFRNLCGSNLIL
jgi:hypothetical protein